MELMIGLLISAVIFGVIGMAIGDYGGKKNGPMGALLGALLGPLGCIIAALLPPGDGAEKKVTGAGEAERIAKLEAELNRMKKGEVTRPAAKSLMKPLVRDSAGDGEVPTYRLD